LYKNELDVMPTQFEAEAEVPQKAAVGTIKCVEGIEGFTMYICVAEISGKLARSTSTANIDARIPVLESETICVFGFR
jgi:hypothetical protein